MRARDDVPDWRDRNEEEFFKDCSSVQEGDAIDEDASGYGSEDGDEWSFSDSRKKETETETATL